MRSAPPSAGLQSGLRYTITVSFRPFLFGLSTWRMYRADPPGYTVVMHFDRFLTDWSSGTTLASSETNVSAFWRALGRASQLSPGSSPLNHLRRRPSGYLEKISEGAHYLVGTACEQPVVAVVAVVTAKLHRTPSGLRALQ